jgi:hypothetical protein
MSVDLNDVLTLVGRLDDAYGFDTPRDRFRRFLLDTRDLATLGSLIEQGHRALGEQAHRALQDALVVLGRFLGFETTFGSYGGAGLAKYEGFWRSRGRLEILLDLRTSQTTATDVADLSRALMAFAAARPPEGASCQVGLLVTTPTYGGRARLEDSLRTASARSTLRLASSRALLWMADMLGAGRLSHDEIVQLVSDGLDLDFAVGLCTRFAAIGSRHVDDVQPAAAEDGAAPPGEAPGPACWVALLGDDETATPEQFVATAIAQRAVLGVAATEGGHTAEPGDRLCFLLEAKGVVGHADVASKTDGAGLLRGWQRFDSVLKLTNVAVYDVPVEPGRPELAHRLAAAAPADGARPYLVPVSRQQFAELTAARARDAARSA